MGYWRVGLDSEAPSASAARSCRARWHWSWAPRARDCAGSPASIANSRPPRYARPDQKPQRLERLRRRSRDRPGAIARRRVMRGRLSLMASAQGRPSRRIALELPGARRNHLLVLRCSCEARASKDAPGARIGAYWIILDSPCIAAQDGWRSSLCRPAWELQMARWLGAAQPFEIARFAGGKGDITYNVAEEKLGSFIIALLIIFASFRGLFSTTRRPRRVPRGRRRASVGAG